MPTTRTQLVTRHTGHRDARLFIVATEGEQTEKQYIEALKFNNVIDRNRILVEVVPTPDGRSSPEYVLERLKDAKSRYELKSFDEFWLLLDVDRWGERKLAQIGQEAHQGSYEMAVSNPCFEVWLALHSVEALPGFKNCDEVERFIRSHWGTYQKANLSVERFSREAVEVAIVRARKLDKDPAARWPRESPGTHVYRLFERLLSKALKPLIMSHT